MFMNTQIAKNTNYKDKLKNKFNARVGTHFFLYARESIFNSITASQLFTVNYCFMSMKPTEALITFYFILFFFGKIVKMHFKFKYCLIQKF